MDDVTNNDNEYKYYMQNLTCNPQNMKLMLVDDVVASGVGVVGRKITRSYCRMWKSDRANDTEKEAYCFGLPEDTDEISMQNDHNTRASDSDPNCKPRNCNPNAAANQEGFCDPSAADCFPPDDLYGCGNGDAGAPSTYEDCDFACEKCKGCSGYFYTNHKDTWNRCQFLRVHKDFLGKDEQHENRTAAPPVSTTITLKFGITHAYLWDLAHEHAPNTGDGTWLLTAQDPSETVIRQDQQSGAPATVEAAFKHTASSGSGNGHRYVKDGAVMRICAKLNSFKRADDTDDLRVLGFPDTV